MVFGTVGTRDVATVMGSAFGAEGYVRISFATSMENLREGLDRMDAFVRGGTIDSRFGALQHGQTALARAARSLVSPP